MEVLKKISYALDKIVNILIVFFFSLLIFSCVLQVYTRFVLNKAFSWTEELARYTFIWANLLGAVVCSKKGSHATVTALSDRFSPRGKRVVNIFIQIIVILIAVVMIKYGWKVTYTSFIRKQTSAAMKINMAFVNIAVPITGLFILIHSFIHLLESIFTVTDVKRGDF
ncbi:TRAP transporter small permease [Fusobacterium sp. PH5-44]|uniref:TRAP transporter small permease n=1 Tax=unclassified Fusobacterium TaxID=2648384 RepID=UPI003D1A4D91